MRKPVVEGSVVKATPPDCREMARVIARAIQVVTAQYYKPDVIANLVKLYTARNLQSHIRDKYVLVFKHEGAILGTGALCGSEISMVYVDPNARGRGIGTIIMRELEHEAVENGVDELHLDASLGSLEFYDRLKYLRGERGAHQKGLGETVHMHKSKRSKR
jgi:GNAT superfamily N-acetyltransferase